MPIQFSQSSIRPHHHTSADGDGGELERIITVTLMTDVWNGARSDPIGQKMRVNAVVRNGLQVYGSAWTITTPSYLIDGVENPALPATATTSVGVARAPHAGSIAWATCHFRGIFA